MIKSQRGRQVLVFLGVIAAGLVWIGWAKMTRDPHADEHAQQRAVAELLERARRDPVVAFEIGQHYLGGYSGEKDPATAAGWFELAGEKGYIPALINRGWMSETGTGVPQSAETALTYYRRAAELGSKIGQFDAALVLMRDGHYEEAIPWLSRPEAMTHPPAIYWLGVLYDRGLGIAADPDEALRLYHRAAALGDDKAKVTIGRRSLLGSGSAQRDVAAAVHGLTEAAGRDDVNALTAIKTLARLYDYGADVVLAGDDAFAVFQRSTDPRNTAALEVISDAYERGVGVTHSDGRAYRYLSYASRTVAPGDPRRADLCTQLMRLRSKLSNELRAMIDDEVTGAAGSGPAC